MIISIVIILEVIYSKVNNKWRCGLAKLGTRAALSLIALTNSKDKTLRVGRLERQFGMAPGRLRGDVRGVVTWRGSVTKRPTGVYKCHKSVTPHNTCRRLLL